MPTFTYSLGKGLKEPCSPRREAYFFGAALNSISADGWNCIPQIVDATKDFNLSALPENREVVVAFVGVDKCPTGDSKFRFKWYRERDDKLLFEYSFTLHTFLGGWAYSYSYIGYVDWELAENGNYWLEITITGAISYKKIIAFTVSGIPKVITPVPVPVGFFPAIVSWLSSIKDFCFSLKDDVSGVPVLGEYLAIPFLYIGNAFDWLAYHFSNFALAWYDVADKITNILNFDNIYSYFKEQFDAAINAWNWVVNAFWNIWDTVDIWWSATSTDVLDWITAAKDWAWLWIKYLDERIDKLQFPSWLDIDKFIIDTLKVWFPFYNSLVYFWDDVADFFSDPLQWLYDRAENFFERFW